MEPKPNGGCGCGSWIGEIDEEVNGGGRMAVDGEAWVGGKTWQTALEVNNFSKKPSKGCFSLNRFLASSGTL